MTELWDAYDKDFNKYSNVTLTRGNPIPPDMYHLVSEIVVKHVDGSYLLMHRDPRKPMFGGLWELTAGGSVLKGENELEGAIRELKEETGISGGTLTEFMRTRRERYRTLFVDYLYITDCDKDSIVIQEGETIGYRWITREELLAMKLEETASKRTLPVIQEMERSARS